MVFARWSKSRAGRLDVKSFYDKYCLVSKPVAFCSKLVPPHLKSFYDEHCV